ncbi:CDP-alcohol phosphatidyltransferase family protein [Rosettibacter firmus]|uniref:CDP-alcohol phosphatidyltransferase family protein n=1 Tax=Rosettibacter firmus TaxID=3111522 RepID=UPI00336C1E84
MNKHTRVNDILLGPLERPALKWLAQKMPDFITPDILTVIGLIGSFITGLSYYLSSYDELFLWIASLGLVINWFGDSLDGTLARYRKIERPKYGYFIDHTLDSLSIIAIAIGAGLSPYARFDFVMFALVGYLLMSILVYIRTYVYGIFKISYYKIGPTEVRLIIIILNTLVYFWGANEFAYEGEKYTILDVGALILAIGLLILFIVSVIFEGRKLKNTEINNVDK